MYVSKLSFSQTTYRPIGNSVHSEVEATLTMFLPSLLVISPGMEVIDLPQRAPQSHFSFEGSLVDPRLRASNEHIPIVRVPRAGGRPGSPLFLFILSIELRDHLIGQVQLRLIIEHNPHGRLVPLVDDGHIPVRFDHSLRSRLHFS